MILSNDVNTVNQIRPSKYPWAWEFYLQGQNNNWTPTEVRMQKDVSQWASRDVLSEDERLVVKRCMGFFAAGESLVGNNLFQSIFRYVSGGECRQYLGRQMYEENLHNQTVVYICDSLGLDEDEVFQAYKNIPIVKEKEAYLRANTERVYEPDFDINTDEGKQAFLKNVIVYYITCEGLLFYSGFAALLNITRQDKKLPGIGEMIKYSLRDEAIHVSFGVRLINTIKQEYPQIWTVEFRQEIQQVIRDAVDLEARFAAHIVPNGILGLNQTLISDYLKFLANYRCSSIGISPVYPPTKNPFPWLLETIELGKESNFFEARVNEYRSAGQLKDDF
jgi:ribonucleoside-diphosphate reductase beta chain